ncbi:hypothetical protein FRZ67_07820 [Panacibacter ginsenosidivorans]|uniref:Cytochrome B n=1 Tax=Panacibacter ginsenosidivorans TaxID=1813871 RepID=A0A5B8V911_9BACT|nr:hypothetical protein [Panacibacter ginsenosidivorans]QEC67206.1 hypothetical protein FRZ67_07820 [Panacibacter ginsenosidivorans]
MYTVLLYLHSILRWIILALLVINIIKIATGNSKIKYSKWLLIAAHTTLLIGLYQYFAGGSGYALIQQNGMAAVMKDATMRFWAVEHISGMIVSIAFITIAHVSLKGGNTKKANMFFVLALILILAVVPWPFRDAVGRPLLPGM